MNELSFNLIKSFIFIYLLIYSIFLHYLSGFHKFVDKAIETLLKNGTLCFGMKYTYGFYEFMIKKED